MFPEFSPPGREVVEVADVNGSKEVRSSRGATIGLVSALAALALTAGAQPATAAVTIGQTGPPFGACNNLDLVQATVTSGNSYVVPATGGIGNWTITSWSTQAGAAGMLAIKAYRPLGGPTYRVVGHDGPHPLTPSTLNTFPASVAVKAGDMLGISGPAGSNPGCRFSVAMGDAPLYRAGNLADGGQGDFNPDDPGERLNVSGVVAPTNSFTLGKVEPNRKKGTATITLEDIPNPGELVLAGKGVKQASASGAVVAKTVTTPGNVQLKIRAKGKKKRKLNETGKVKVKPSITFTPTGGAPNTQSLKLKLKKR
jgi:hypothetical protein